MVAAAEELVAETVGKQLGESMLPHPPRTDQVGRERGVSGRQQACGRGSGGWCAWWWRPLGREKRRGRSPPPCPMQGPIDWAPSQEDAGWFCSRTADSDAPHRHLIHPFSKVIGDTCPQYAPPMLSKPAVARMLRPPARVPMLVHPPVFPSGPAIVHSSAIGAARSTPVSLRVLAGGRQHSTCQVVLYCRHPRA